MLNVSVASGRSFSTVPTMFWTGEPSPQSTVADSESSQPGSRTLPAMVT